MSEFSGATQKAGQVNRSSMHPVLEEFKSRFGALNSRADKDQFAVRSSLKKSRNTDVSHFKFLMRMFYSYMKLTKSLQYRTPSSQPFIPQTTSTATDLTVLKKPHRKDLQ